MGIYVRFEYGQEGRISQTYGPYEFVQQTYEDLRVEPVGGDGTAVKELARIIHGLWVVDGVTYSDFIVYGDKS